MPKILITGNGFDLNYNLPTHYSDFINILNFIEKNEEYNFLSIYQNVSKYQDIINDYNSFELDVEAIQGLKSLLKNNLWYNFFSSEYKIDTWIDFENRIEYVLTTIFNSIKTIRNIIFDENSLDINHKNKFLCEIFKNNILTIKVLEDFKIIESNLYEFIINQDFLIEKHKYYVDIDDDKYYKFILKDLINFKEIFNKYFEIFIFPFYNNYKKQINNNLFLQFTDHYTFNYTPTFKNLLKVKSIKTNFLHGKIESKKNKIVLGINEIPKSFFDYKYLIPFTKSFQKLDNHTDYLFLKEFENYENDNYMIFLWGHSLDKSDKKYIDEVFNFINEVNSDIKKIVIIYHSEKSKSQLLTNLIDIRGEDDIEKLMKERDLIFAKSDSELLNSLVRENINSTHDPMSFVNY